MSSTPNQDFRIDRAYAQELDARDPLAHFRDRFHIPVQPDGREHLYFCGNSLGLQPKSVRGLVEETLDDWAKLGVEGHLHARHPWLPYHEFLTNAMADVVGGLPGEVVVMNSLTVNLHLLMVSFYRPTAKRHKVIIEADAFPSDRYAVISQIQYHGFDPKESLIELRSRSGHPVIPTEEVLEAIAAAGDGLALVMLGGVNYYTGQAFEMDRITAAGHAVGAKVGFDLAHGAGNLHLRLHDWGPDFACWCGYKYLNSGPGGLSGIFVHERHANATDLPRFAGWWGHNKDNRFKMPPYYEPLAGAEGWQLSNPPILAMAALYASLQIFAEAGMPALRAKSEQMTAYLEQLIQARNTDESLRIITPSDPHQRGCQLSLQTLANGRATFDRLTAAGVIADWREPDVIRIAPVPLYNRFVDCWDFVELLCQAPMAAYNFPNLLTTNGWTAGATALFPEKAGQGASAYYSYHNAKGNRLTLAVFEADKIIRFRIYDQAQPDAAWFQIGIDEEVDQVIAEIDARRDEVTRVDAFGFYFAISGLGDVSILAWEQYEDGYV